MTDVTKHITCSPPARMVNNMCLLEVNGVVTETARIYQQSTLPERDFVKARWAGWTQSLFLDGDVLILVMAMFWGLVNKVERFRVQELSRDKENQRNEFLKANWR